MCAVTSGVKCNGMSGRIRVALLDDHQPVIDGYLYRLEKGPRIEVVGTAQFGTELEALLVQRPVDVVILDVSVPTSPTNRNPYPILHVLPTLLLRYPGLAALVISMLTDRTLIRSLLDAGASGYILKDDAELLRQLVEVVESVAAGGVHLSQAAYEQIRTYGPKAGEPLLTPRQLEALSLCGAYPGDPLTALAGKLSISDSTLRNLLSTAYVRLGVRNRTEAILKARELGLITPVPPSSLASLPGLDPGA